MDIEDTLVEIGVLRFCGVAKKRSKNDIYRTPKIELTAADGAALAKENSHHAWVNIHSIGYPNEREMELVGEWIDMYEHVWPFTARLNLKN
ncbi:MAG: hypothetical protein EOO38_28675 [Cytophagaceae bacterium]|nr:MAG: hypothetical protein EOO38_28675 [Cytophagaceae bacterium]